MSLQKRKLAANEAEFAAYRGETVEWTSAGLDSLAAALLPRAVTAP